MFIKKTISLERRALRSVILFTAFFFFASLGIHAQTNFRSNGTGGGSWSTISTWQVESPNGSNNWIAASSTPSYTSGTIQIRANDIVTVSNPVTIDQTTIDANGTISVSNVQLALVNTANALVVNGTLSVTGGTGIVNNSASSNIVFNSGSTYTHNRDSGVIPPAIWGTGSLCNITGFTNVAPTGFNPAGGFYKFIWNCPGQTRETYLEKLTTVANDLIVTTTNGQQLFFFSSPIGPTINVGGNLQIDGDSRIGIVTSGTNAIVNIAGNFNYNSTNATGSELKDAGSYTINVSGNFNMNAPGGTLNFSRGNGTTGTMNLNGDFTLAAGTLTTTAGRGAINFNKVGTQQYINNGTIGSTSVIDFTIGASTTLNMLAESSISGRGNLVVNGILRLGSTNVDGALTSGTSLGNITNTYVNRTYNSGCKIVYGGVSAQVIGSGHPSSSGVTTEIENANGVTFNTVASGNSGTTIMLIPGDLILTNGNLNIVGSPTVSRSLALNGNITANSNNITFSGVNTSLVINGTGALGVFPTPITGQTIQNFTFNRTSGSATFSPLTILGTATITNGTVTFGGTTSIAGNVSLSSGTVMAFDGQSLSMAGNFTSSGLLSASGTSSLSLTGATPLTSSLNFVPTNNTLHDLTINKTNTSGTSVQIGSSTLNITNNLTLTDGFLDIANALNMSNGSTINFNATGANPSSITTSSPSGGPWNLNYTGDLGFNTGLEIPASGSLLSLSSSNSNFSTAITLGQSLNIGSGGITINAGTFNCGANAVSTSSLTINGGTFKAPTSSCTLSGNLTVNGAYNSNSGTIVFGGNTTISGTNASSTNFDNITISGTLTPSSILNVQRNFINNGALIAGANTINFSGLNVQTISGTANTQFYNLTVNKGSGSVTINSPETITNNLTLIIGILNISSGVSVSGATSQVILNAGSLAINSNLLALASGSTITRAGGGAITTSNPSGGPWNLVYTGVTKTTGLEIPTSGNLVSVTINVNNGAWVTLASSQPLNVAGALTTNSGTTFNSGSNNVSVGSLSNNGTFNAPSIVATVGLTLNGSLTNNGTFNSGTGTVIIGGTVSINGTIPTLNNLTVSSSGVFNVPNALTLQGNLQNNGSIATGTGTITFSGNTAKTITGSSKTVFNNITVNDGTQAKDLSLETTAGADLKGILTMGASAVFDTDGAGNNRVFTLLSTADKPTSDASIAALSGAAQLPGKITVQRYLSRIGVAQYDYQVWRDISSPVNTTVSDLQNSLPVTGPFTNASVVSGADNTFSSMTRYDESVGGAIENGWTDFPVSTGNSQTTFFTRGLGYSIFIYGSSPPVSVNNNESFSLTGVVWNGTFNLPVTFTSSGDISNDGWNLVGNPYPSSIDWNSLGWTKTNIDDAIYIDDYNGVQPVFASYVNGVSTNGGSNLIGMGQGFWVKANAASPVLTIQESVKSAGSQTTYFRQAAPQNLLRVTLSKDNDNFKDETVIYFSESSSLGFDRKFDALKFKNRNSLHNLSSLSPTSNERYSINSLPFLTSLQIVPLDISNVTSGSYQLSFNGLASFSPNLHIQLRDDYLNSIIDLTKEINYTFSVDQKKPATFGSNRFSIVFSQDKEVKSDIEVKAYPNPVVNVLTVETYADEAHGQILNALGVAIGTLSFERDERKLVARFNFVNESKGLYFVKVSRNNRAFVVRVVKD